MATVNTTVTKGKAFDQLMRMTKQQLVTNLIAERELYRALSLKHYTLSRRKARSTME